MWSLLRHLLNTLKIVASIGFYLLLECEDNTTVDNSFHFSALWSRCLLLSHTALISLVTLQALKCLYFELATLRKNYTKVSFLVESCRLKLFFLASSSAILLPGMLLRWVTHARFKESCLAITISDMRQFFTVFNFTVTNFIALNAAESYEQDLTLTPLSWDNWQPAMKQV